MSAWVTSTSPRPCRTSGSSRASRAASATSSTSLRASSRRSCTSPPRSSPASTRRSARPTSSTSRTRCKRRVRADLRRPRRAARRARRAPRASPRRSSPPARTSGFDEDDEFWARGLSNWAEDQVLPGSRRRARSRAASSPTSPRPIATRIPKRIRELVRQTATRDDRRLAPREIESVATAAVEIRAALDPLRDELDKAIGLEEGRDHEAPAQGARRAADGRRALRRRRRARRVGRREEPRSCARGRQRPPAAVLDAGRGGHGDRAGARARVRPLPRRGRPQGRPRGRHAVGHEGQARWSGHREPSRGHARGGRRGRPPARGDVEALPRALGQAGRQRRAALPRAQGPLRLALRLRRVLPGRHGRGVDPRAAPRPRSRRRSR